MRLATPSRKPWNKFIASGRWLVMELLGHLGLSGEVYIAKGSDDCDHKEKFKG